MKLKIVLILILPLILLFSCRHAKQRWLKVDVTTSPIEKVKIQRYEKAIFNIDKNNLKDELKQLSRQYPLFLQGDLDDTLKLIQISEYLNDPVLNGVYQETMKEYPVLDDIEEQLTTAFKYFNHYFPSDPVPQVYSYLSGLDYQEPVLYGDSVLVIALDMYLGPGYQIYKDLGLPEYMIRKFDKIYLVRDCINEMASAQLRTTEPGNTLLDRMIYEGKNLLLLDAMLPGANDNMKIKYTPEQLEWCKKNESNLWKFMIQNDILYSTDNQVIDKFFVDGPFTSGFEGSPSRLGSWIGWQIVRAYMNKQVGMSLSPLIKETNSQKILTGSRYKPAR
jgi:uncharacterized protein YjaZ